MIDTRVGILGKFQATDKGNLQLPMPITTLAMATTYYGVAYRIAGASQELVDEAFKLLMHTTVAQHEVDKGQDMYHVAFGCGYALNKIFGLKSWRTHASLPTWKGEMCFDRCSSVSFGGMQGTPAASIITASPTTFTHMASGMWVTYKSMFTFLTNVPPRLLHLVASDAIEIAMSASHVYQPWHIGYDSLRMPYLGTHLVFAGPLTAGETTLAFPVDCGPAVAVWISCQRELSSLVMELQYGATKPIVVVKKCGGQLKAFRDAEACLSGTLVALNADDGEDEDLFSDVCITRKDICNRVEMATFKLVFAAATGVGVEEGDKEEVTVHIVEPNVAQYFWNVAYGPMHSHGRSPWAVIE
jgi:hypothetical protein